MEEKEKRKKKKQLRNGRKEIVDTIYELRKELIKKNRPAFVGYLFIGKKEAFEREITVSF